MSPSPEQRLARAFSHRRRWEREARAAVLDARAAGLSFADIARAAGISRQGARKILEAEARP